MSSFIQTWWHKALTSWAAWRALRKNLIKDRSLILWMMLIDGVLRLQSTFIDENALSTHYGLDPHEFPWWVRQWWARKGQEEGLWVRKSFLREMLLKGDLQNGFLWAQLRPGKKRTVWLELGGVGIAGEKHGLSGGQLCPSVSLPHTDFPNGLEGGGLKKIFFKNQDIHLWIMAEMLIKRIKMNKIYVTKLSSA